MPTYGDTYCRVCDLPIASCVRPPPGFCTAPAEAEWLRDAVALLPSGHSRAIRPRDDRCRYCWVFDDDAPSDRPEDDAVAGNGGSGTLLPTCDSPSCAWIALHAKCLGAVQAVGKAPHELVAFVADMPTGMWGRFQEQFFRWELVLPGIDATICDMDALNTWLDNRVRTTSQDIVRAVAIGGMWNPPGSARATRCLCDKCDKPTRHAGCFSKDGLDVCGDCAFMYIPKHL